MDTTRTAAPARPSRRRRRGLAAAVAAVAGLAGCSTAAPGSVHSVRRPAAHGSAVFAPLHRPGPSLTPSRRALAAALSCHGRLGRLGRSPLEPVLLSPGTGETPTANFSWNYERRFSAEHRPWCALSPPHHTRGDIQIAGEYIVHAIRVMHARAHRRIAVVGHSQGGMSMRWALRFWPDTRRMVDDVIGLAGDNHGTTTFGRVCRPGRRTCTAAVWQQIAGSRFLAALNSRAETFAGISYTEVFTRTDRVVQPSSPDRLASSALHTGAGRVANIALQSICSGDVSQHLQIGTTDPVAAALVDDALDHPGPARASRISPAVCHRSVARHVDLRVAGHRISRGDNGGMPPHRLLLAHEPPLACYVFRSGCSPRRGR